MGGTSAGGTTHWWTVRPRVVLCGMGLFVAATVWCLAAGWVALELVAPGPDLGVLLDEAIWTEIPPGAEMTIPAFADEECGSGRSASVLMRVATPTGGQAALDFYEGVARRTGWTLTDDPQYPGATKRVRSRDPYVGFLSWDQDGGGAIEIRGHSRPNGC